MKKNILIIILTIFLAVLLSGAVSATKNSDLDTNSKYSADYQSISLQVFDQNSETSPTTESQSSQNSGDPVNLRTQKSYSTIQDAIDDQATRNGDIILVEPGFYTENVVVHKSLGIISSGTATVQAADPNLPVFTINAPFTVISNFTITGSNSYGILIQSSLNVIKNNQITNNGHGIGMIPSSSIHQVVFGNSIYKNRIIGNNGDGVYIESSPLNYIANNDIKSNTNYGLHLQSSIFNKITKNDLTLNGLGDRLITGESYKNTFTGNNPLP